MKRLLAKRILQMAAFVLGFGGVLTLVLFATADGTFQRTQGRSATTEYQEWLAKPLDDAVETTLEEARARGRFDHFVLPAHELANRKSADATWVSAAGAVAIRFESDVVMVLDKPAFPDATAEFQGLVESGSVKGSVDSLNGSAVLQIEPGSDVTGENPGAVLLVFGDRSPTSRDGTFVSLYGKSLSAERLTEIAGTLSPGN